MQRFCYLPEALCSAVCEDGCSTVTCRSINRHLIKRTMWGSLSHCWCLHSSNLVQTVS